MALSDILLRILTHATLQTKGSVLTHEELDTNIIELADQFLAMLDSLEVYDNTKTYLADKTYFVSYNGNVWKFIGASDSTGNPPVAGVRWELSSVGQATANRGEPNQLVATLNVVASTSIDFDAIWKNTTGATFTWTYVGDGNYILNSSVPMFDSTRTNFALEFFPVIPVDGVDGAGGTHIPIYPSVASPTQLTISALVNGTPSDGALTYIVPKPMMRLTFYG